jgi:ATP-dependent Clp protease ATP-binding subunit ClpC
VDEKLCPARLKGHRLFSLELSNLVAGTKYRGEFEERLQSIIKEVTDPKAPPTILFIDEIHNLVGAGAAEGGMDAANLLKPALARGELQLIGATTIMEYRKYIEKDAALERRLQPVMVKEPSVVQTIDILQAVQSNYEKHHGVTYTSAALNAAATLSDRYMTDRFLPDKALDLLDEAGAIAHLEEPDEDVTPEVTEHTVAMVISEWSGIPMGKLETQEMDRLQALEGEMGRRVKGQGRAIRGVARAVRRARSGLRDPRRPVASFLFCGPTGTGKTELCKTLAETYYGSEKDMIRIDMSEYMEKHSVSRLTGPPPG